MSCIEICTETIDGVRAATVGGAQRIELCSALHLDGLTPSEELFLKARAATELELLVMVRPEPGSFVVSAATLQTMCTQIEHYRTLGADGFVCGCLLPSDEVDVASVKQLVAAAAGLPITFHRAFDVAPDLLAACDALIACGVKRILTSGGAATAMEGLDVIKQLLNHVHAHLEVVVGGSVRAHNLARIQESTGAAFFHSALDRAPTTQAVRELIRECRRP